jgi:hypothetical protein
MRLAPPILSTALALVVALLAAGAPPAAAGPQVPDVGRAELPEAGTCAPIAGASVTWVTVGEPGFYRIDGDSTDVGTQALFTHLAQQAQAAANAGSNHEAWILVSAQRVWQRVVDVLQLCPKSGVFRVGLQVRAEGSDALYGFPLFLPVGRGPGVTPTGTAHELPVVMQVVRDEPSDPRGLFAAAQAAASRFGPVVADLSIPPDASVQDAVRAIDLLYRAGCIAVRTPTRMGARNIRQPGPVRISVNGRPLLSDAPTVDIPPIQPRKMPWPDSGAAQAGSFGLILERIPTGDGSAAAASRMAPLPSYAETGREVPPDAWNASGERVRDWAVKVGPWLGRVLQPGKTEFPGDLLVKRRRQLEGVEQMFAEARQTFPGADRVVVATVRLQAFLFRGADAVGRVDVTLDLSGETPSVVFGSWVPGQYPPGAHLPPRETDPFATGVPGHLRVWLEGLLVGGKARGASAVPLAPESRVLANLPDVAHPSVLDALRRRQAAVENLVGWLRATPYDRVFVATVEGSAAVTMQGRIAGLLRFAIESEGGGLRLSSMKAKAAPR